MNDISRFCLGVMVTAEVSPRFSTGQLHSYFGGRVPDDFGSSMRIIWLQKVLTLLLLR